MRKISYLLALVILIIAGFLRFNHLDQAPPGLYSDEAMNGSNLQKAIRENDFPVFYPENNGREALFINIQAFVLKAAMAATNLPPEPWMLRLTSAIFGTLSVLLLYLMVMEMGGGRNAALASSFFMATSFWHLNFSRIGFRAITAPFWLLLALWLLWLGFRKLRENKNIGWPIMFLSGLSLGAGFHSYIAYRVAPAILLIALIFWLTRFWKEKVRFLIASVLVFAGLVVAVYPLFQYFAQNPGSFFGRTTQVSVLSSSSPILGIIKNCIITAQSFFIVGDFNWRHNFAGRPLLYWPVSIAAFYGIWLSLKSVWKVIRHIKRKPEDKDFLSLLMWAWIGATALPVVISNEGLPHALRAILMAPPIMVLAGLGSVGLYERFAGKFGKYKAMSGVIAILIFLLVEVYNAYFMDWAKRPEVKSAFNADRVEMAREIRALPKDVLKVVVIKDLRDNDREIMTAQPIMFMTDSWTQEGRQEQNIIYTSPDNLPPAPENGKVRYFQL